VALLLILMIASFANRAFADSRVVFEWGNWIGKEHHSSETDSFTRCSIGVEYATGTYLTISMSAEMNLEIWLSNKSWELAEGESYPVRLRVDEYQVMHGEAEVLPPKGVYIYIENGEWFLKLLQKGQTLYVYAQENEMRFGLDDSGQALKKMKACTLNALQEQERAGIDTNPFDRDLDPKKYTKRNGTPRTYTIVGPDDAETKAFALNVLMMQPLRHYTKMDVSEKTDAIKRFPMAWRGGGAVGLITRLEGLGLERLAVALTQNRQGCDGRFEISKTPFALRDGGKGMQLSLMCHEEDSLSEVISLYPAKVGGYFAVVHFAKDGAQAIKADRQFFLATNDMLRGY